jgi:hypothetical protein
MLFLRLLALALLSSGSASLKQAGAALFLQRGMPEAEVHRVLGDSYGIGGAWRPFDDLPAVRRVRLV